MGVPLGRAGWPTLNFDLGRITSTMGGGWPTQGFDLSCIFTTKGAPHFAQRSACPERSRGTVFARVGIRQPRERTHYTFSVPRDLKRYYSQGHLHFVTFSCYRRLAFLGTARRRDLVLRILERTRVSYGFSIVGYVVMPEHLHILVSEPQRTNLSTALKAFKQAVGRRVLNSSRRKDPRQIVLFAVTRPARFWQPRFYDFNVFTPKKRVEKLKYMHRNPVARGLVPRPEDWRWSSYRFYALGEVGLVTIDPFPVLTPTMRP